MVIGPPSMTRDISGVLRRLAEGVSVRPVGESSDLERASIRLENVLESLIDLGGTVRIADHLATRERVAEPGPEAPISPLRESFARTIDEIRDDARTAFAEPFTGRRAMPSLDVLRRMLAERSALESRDEASTTAVATALTAQARERFDHHLGKGRQRIRWLRTDVAAQLRALGPRSASVEALDAVFSRAIESGAARVHRVLETRLDEIFVARLRAALLALPEGSSDLTSLYDRSGMMTRHAQELAELLVVTLETELDAVLALIDTAYALRNQEATA